MSEREHNTVAWTKVAGPTVGKTGTRFEWSVTVRGDGPTDMIEQIKYYEVTLIKAGCIPLDAYVDQRRSDRQQQRDEQQPIPQNGNNPQISSCNALKLMAMQRKENEPQLMWKVLTDKSKYAVPMYEEACQENAALLSNHGIDLGQFIGANGQPAQYDLTGWTAHYLANDKGWPSKIVRLSK